jgi:branched-subunit amino acid ABC-type transport system permease component
MENFLAQLVNGLTLGSTYALVALGVVLIFSVLDVMSVTQGQIFIFSAYIGFVWVMALTGNIVLAAIAVVIASLLIGGVVERFAVRPALSGGHIGTLITTVGVGLVLSNLVVIIFGPYTQVVPNNAITHPWKLGGVTVRPIDLLAIAALVVGFIVLRIVIGRTSLGSAIRAVSENQDVASMFGIRVKLLRSGTFIVGSGFAGLAAVILAFKYGNLQPDLGIEFTLKALTVAIIGGAGRIEGAVIAAFGLGIAESLTTAYIGGDFSNLVGYALLLIVMVAFPEGIFRRQIRRAG